MGSGLIPSCSVARRGMMTSSPKQEGLRCHLLSKPSKHRAEEEDDVLWVSSHIREDGDRWNRQTPWARRALL